MQPPTRGSCTVPRRHTDDTRHRGYWGPSAWRLIHWVALHEPQRLSSRWFQRLAKLLPCAECCAHLTANLTALPFPTATGNLFAWTVKLHNRVNTQIGKATVSAAFARRQYEGGLEWEHVRPFFHSVAMSIPLPCRLADDLRAFFSALGVQVRDARSRRAIVRALLGTPCATSLAVTDARATECRQSCSTAPAP